MLNRHSWADSLAVIEDFSVSQFTRFLSTACSAFKPVTEDFGYYLEDADGLFSDFNKIGQIEFPDGQTLIAAAVKVNNELTEQTSKKKQYDLAKKVLKETHDNAGLFLFYDDKGHFRLSLICVQYMGPKREFTNRNFRRYTYFVSPDISNKTFLSQMGKCGFASIDDILEAFSIEAVSNGFYNEFKPKFDEIAAAVEGLPEIDSNLRENFALLFSWVSSRKRAGLEITKNSFRPIGKNTPISLTAMLFMPIGCGPCFSRP